MDTSGIITLLISVVILGWLLVKQLSVRPLKDRSVLWVVFILVGLVQTANFVQGVTLNVSDVLLLLLSIAVGMGLAAARAFTTVTWRGEDGVLYRKGNWLTAILWIIGIGQHLLIDHFVIDGFGTASIMLYFGIVIAVQRQVLLLRVRRGAVLSAAPVSGRGAGTGSGYGSEHGSGSESGHGSGLGTGHGTGGNTVGSSPVG